MAGQRRRRRHAAAVGGAARGAEGGPRPRPARARGRCGGAAGSRASACRPARLRPAQVRTGRCWRTWQLGAGPVAAVAWCPLPGPRLLSAAVGSSVLVLPSGTGPEESGAAAEEVIRVRAGRDREPGAWRTAACHCVARMGVKALRRPLLAQVAVAAGAAAAASAEAAPVATWLAWQPRPSGAGGAVGEGRWSPCATPPAHRTQPLPCALLPARPLARRPGWRGRGGGPLQRRRRLGASRPGGAAALPRALVGVARPRRLLRLGGAHRQHAGGAGARGASRVHAPGCAAPAARL